MKPIVYLLIAVLITGQVLAQTAPSPRMNLRDFTEFHLRVDTNGNGIIEPSEDGRSQAARDRLASLKRGVQVMKSRKPSDPKSWFFQAAIHGVTDEAIVAAAEGDPDVANVNREMFWNRCPHNGESSADFIVWHRAYLYYFELILREASGDQTLSLPYWDYTGGQKGFPAAFADPERPPGDIIPRNPLYSNERELAFAGGRVELSDAVTINALTALMNENNFFGATEMSGLAGGVYDSEPRTMGLIERRPHNDIHVAIGGLIGNDFAGLMSEVRTAAFDPIFWVHHANIDRLVEVWFRKPNASWGHFPNISWFLDRPWFFYDQKGVIHNNQRLFYLKEGNLDVTYDNVDQNTPKLTDKLPYDFAGGNEFLTTLPKGFSLDTETGLATSTVAPACACCKLTEGIATLSRTDVRDLSLEVAGNIDSTRELLKREPLFKRPEKQPVLILEVSYRQPEFAPNVGYEVFAIYTSNGTEWNVSVGNISFFGAKHHRAHGPEGGNFVTQQFDASTILAEIEGDARNVKVQIRPYALYKEINGAVAPIGGDLEVTNVDILLR
jgi:hypothetical protein